MITIRDVAKAAGVSPATVSRVINGTASVDSIKREKVVSVIKELGFRPNEVARSLSKKSSQTIGLLIPSIVNPFFNQIAEAVENTANHFGYKLILCNTHNNPKREKEYIESLILKQTDGFLVVSDSKTLDQVIEKIRVPVVALDRYVSHNINDGVKYPIIRTDNYQGGRMAAQHLIDCGCTKIAHIGRPEGSLIAEGRAQGFNDVLRENGMDYVVITCPYDYNEGLESAGRLLQEYPGIDGVFAGNDLIAFALIAAAFSKGISIPEQIQLVGYDDIMFSQIVTPALTTVSQPIDLLGKTAAELLINRIAGIEVPIEEVILPLKLIVRGTTRAVQSNAAI